MTDEDKALNNLRALLSEKWDIEKIGKDSRTFHLWDSYVGSLLQVGMAMLEFSGKPGTIELLPGKIKCKVAKPLGLKPLDPSSLPCDALARAVSKELGAWRLERITQGIESIERYRIVNEDRKGVARLQMRTFNCDGGSATTVSEVKPYRGYGDEAASISQRISDLYPPDSLPVLLFRSFPETVRRHSEPVPEVMPTDGARESVVNLIRHILNRVRCYEPGVLEDSDPELLHQYRVSIRRIRSLISLLKNVFLPKELQMLRIELKAAMQSTNRLRDLDVQMRELATIRSSLPYVLRPGLDRLIQGLTLARRKKFEAVYQTLHQTTFDERFFKVTTIRSNRTEAGTGSIADMLVSVIGKRYRRIMRDTHALGKKPDPRQLHGLRISCKKLRYLMDFFPEILNHDPVKPLLKDLKKLQTLLGRYNDLCVLEASLLKQEKQYTNDSVALMATGAVLMRMNRERRRLVKRCAAAALKFCSAENKHSVKHILKKDLD